MGKDISSIQNRFEHIEDHCMRLDEFQCTAAYQEFQMSGQDLNLDAFTIEYGDDDDVYEQLAKTQNYLVLAAEAGNALLEKNRDLEQTLDAVKEELAEKTEEFEANTHSMKRSYHEKEASYEAQIHNLSIDIQILTTKLETSEKKAKYHRHSNIGSCREIFRNNESLKYELNQAASKNAELSLQVQTMKRRIEGRATSWTATSEEYDMMEFKMANEQVHRLLSEKKNLEETISELAAEKILLLQDAEKSSQRITMLDQTSKDLKQQISIMKSDLEISKASNLQLKEQLEDYIMQASFSKFQNNNSLMNELETSLTDVEDTKNFINGINGLNNYVPTFTSSPKKSQKHVVNGDQSNEMETHCFGANKPTTNGDTSTMESLEKQVLELNQKLNDSSRSYEQLSKKYSAARNQLRDAESKVEKMVQQIRCRNREVEMYKRERDVIMTQESLDQALRISLEDRKKACEAENQAMFELDQVKTDMIKLNDQLLEAVQQKLALSEQLEMWQVDMATLIEKQLQGKPGKNRNKEHARSSRLFSGRWSWTSNASS